MRHSESRLSDTGMSAEEPGSFTSLLESSKTAAKVDVV